MSFKKVLSKITDLFYPRRCTICDSVIGKETGICKSCQKKTMLLTGSVCMICGKRLKEDTTFCYDCSRKQHAFLRNFAVFEYPVIKESLYRFKYKGRAEYAAYYAKQAYVLHGKRLLELHADALVPVPLHKKRYRKRGYNQAEELAFAISPYLSVPVNTKLIKRVKSTRPLKTLDAEGRQNNLKKAFLIMQNDVKLNTIILVDDIYTTGATLDEISRLLLAAGVKNVYSLTVAVGNGM